MHRNLDRDRQRQIDQDADEMLWEEMEQNLHNTGRISPNSLVLMALGGIIAAASVAASPSGRRRAGVLGEAARVPRPAFDRLSESLAAVHGICLHFCSRGVTSGS